MSSSPDTRARPKPLHPGVSYARADGDLGALLEDVAAAIGEAAGFATVAVNLYRREWDDYQVVAVHGRADARDVLLGALYPATHWDALLRAEFRRGGAFLVPAGAFDWGTATSFVPDLPAPASGDCWHPEDALFAPMYDTGGHLLGVISVDEPLSGLRPGDDELDALVALAAHASIVIQSAQASEAARRHQAALAQLFRVSAKLNETGSVDEVLQTICDAIHEALGFQLVVVETPDADRDRYRPRAAAGVPLDADVLEIDVTLERFRSIYEPEFEIEGCYLLPSDEALARVGMTPTRSSTLNGRGPWAWNRHWLIVRLTDSAGREIGFIWADDPTDRQLPSREQLQALRLFADNAQRALVAASQLEALREASERHRALVQSSPTGIIFVGTDGRIRDWNDAARRLFGYDDEAVLGQYPPWIQDRDAYLVRFQEQLEDLQTVEREFTDVRSDGALVRVRTTSAPLLDTDGGVAGVMATIIDVTAEREAEEELARQKGEVEALYATTLALIDRLDLDSVLHTIVTRACDLVGGDGGYLYLIDEERGEARPAVATGMFEGLVTEAIKPEQGLAGLVWRTGEAQVVDDYSAWPRRLRVYHDLGYHGVAGVPIRSGEKIVGVLGVGLLSDGRAFSDTERALLSRFSHLASLALAKSRLYAEARHEVEERRRAEARLERQNTELESLYETGLDLVNRLDTTSVLETIVGRARELAGSDTGFLYLVDEEADVLRPAITVGTAIDVAKLLRRGEGISGRVWATGDPLAIADYARWGARVGGYETTTCNSFVAVPIAGLRGTVGVLGVGFLEGTHDLHARLAQLRRFAQLASLALQNARLYEALRKSEELYRKVVDSASDLISLIDVSGRLVFASPSHETVLGYSPDELVGSPYTESIHPDDLERVAATPAAADIQEPIRVRHRDGHYLHVDRTAVPLFDADGRPEGVLVVARDVSERIHAEEARGRLEQQLRQSQKMEAIGRLAGGVAHDFNNLLTAIGGYAELAAGQVPETSPAQRSIAEIQRASDRAAELTRQLLAYSRKQVLQPKIVDVNDVVRGMRDILARLLGTHIELVTRFDESVGRTRVDPSQLEQVVMNLAINARDAMPTGGRLVLETSAAALDDEDFVLLTVSDTGHGMDADTLKLAFEPFFTTKRAGEGTGLGLSTVYGIVTQTGGRVTAESNPAAGTTLRVYLPHVAGEADDRPQRNAGTGAAGSGTVLLVEDEELVRDLVRELLEAGGYTVIAAADGPAALSLADEHDGRIDALVTDIVMPGMSGQQVAAQLLAKHDGLRVLFTSGYAEDAIATHGELTPGAAFLGKPFSARELAAKLRELLETPRPT